MSYSRRAPKRAIGTKIREGLFGSSEDQKRTAEQNIGAGIWRRNRMEQFLRDAFGIDPGKQAPPEPPGAPGGARSLAASSGLVDGPGLAGGRFAAGRWHV